MHGRHSNDLLLIADLAFIIDEMYEKVVYHIIAMTSARHSKEPDSFTRDAYTYAYKNLGKNIARPKPKMAV
ncbi:hypothetical protein HDU88_004869 [Geranomyces variabilis]|nr:hypothetical protein HDU88_004869 [Geranomyces variabilis]